MIGWILTVKGKACLQKGFHDWTHKALLATLLNFVWLQPHAGSLPRPPQEVVKLLSGVTLPLGNERQPTVTEDDAAVDVLPAAADEQETFFKVKGSRP